MEKLIESENKNKKIKNNNENEIKEKVKVKEESLFDKLYPNGDYEFETKKQQESIMFNLEKENKKINIIISEPQNIEKSGFFYQKKLILFVIFLQKNSFLMLKELLVILNGLKIN